LEKMFKSGLLDNVALRTGIHRWLNLFDRWFSTERDRNVAERYAFRG
jgi:hypothetical protein